MVYYLQKQPIYEKQKAYKKQLQQSMRMVYSNEIRQQKQGLLPLTLFQKNRIVVRYEQEFRRFGKLQQISEVDPTRAQSYEQRGNIIQQMEIYEEVFLNFNEVIQLNSNFANNYENRGHKLFYPKVCYLSFQSLQEQTFFSQFASKKLIKMVKPQVTTLKSQNQTQNMFIFKEVKFIQIELIAIIIS
ncbi:unnamed protein product [Paramecium octaurelia]|uniref:Uncharacterized protein n=1 Tax=Paramecium octaurelia TaxID=43137 RepID=A0A8S1XMR5_PAROT|nr:unnamed protein product [Paramecium octaurelia]